MTLSIIVAASTNNVIGLKNQLPWHLPTDMRYFKNTTWGMPVIMGRKTFKSMETELAGRINIVITRQADWKAKGAVVVNSLKDALFVAGNTDSKEVFVTGGGEIFSDALSKVNKLYITRVHAVVEGDVFFPEFDEKRWKLTWSKDCFKDERHAFDYTFQVWEQ